MYSCSSHVHGTHTHTHYHSKLRLLQPDKTISSSNNIDGICMPMRLCLVQWLQSDAHSDIQTISFFPQKGNNLRYIKKMNLHHRIQGCLSKQSSFWISSTMLCAQRIWLSSCLPLVVTEDLPEPGYILLNITCTWTLRRYRYHTYVDRSK